MMGPTQDYYPNHMKIAVLFLFRFGYLRFPLVTRLMIERPANID